MAVSPPNARPSLLLFFFFQLLRLVHSGSSVSISLCSLRPPLSHQPLAPPPSPHSQAFGLSLLLPYGSSILCLPLPYYSERLTIVYLHYLCSLQLHHCITFYLIYTHMLHLAPADFDRTFSPASTSCPTV